MLIRTCSLLFSSEIAGWTVRLPSSSFTSNMILCNIGAGCFLVVLAKKENHIWWSGMRARVPSSAHTQASASAPQV